jgi:NADH-quinone oxidoreductase subunit J
VEVLSFVFLALVAIAAAVTVITHRNTVMSALALAVNLVCVAGFFMLLSAQFISIVQVIVYAGAIMVLILFVIMLLNLREEAKAHPSGRIQRVAGPLLAGGLVVVLGRMILAGGATSFRAVERGYGTAGALGHDLFSRFYWPFEVISLLLIVAMVGAVLLAKRRL